MLQLAPAEWGLLHEDRVSEHVEGDLHIAQHGVQGGRVAAPTHAAQGRLHVLRPGDLG